MLFQPLRITLKLWAGKPYQATVHNPVIQFASETKVPKGEIGKMQDAVTRTRQRLGRIDKAGVTFLITDLEVALTLTRIASGAGADSPKRIRNQSNARHAYDEVSRISHQALLTGDEREDVDAKLAKLRSALEQLGEVFA